MNIINGIIFALTGCIILLTQADIITLGFAWAWPTLLLLYGLYLILSSQRKMVEKSVNKKAAKHEAKLEKKLEKAHNKEKKVLEKEIEHKDQLVEEAEEVIDDMVNPKL